MWIFSTDPLAPNSPRYLIIEYMHNRLIVYTIRLRQNDTILTIYVLLKTRDNNDNTTIPLKFHNDHSIQYDCMNFLLEKKIK